MRDRNRTANFEVGEHVFVVDGFGPDLLVKKAVVAKVGKLHMTLEGAPDARYSVATGSMVGNGWYRRVVEKATPELEQQYKRQQLLSIISRADWKSMDDETLDVVARAVVTAGIVCRELELVKEVKP